MLSINGPEGRPGRHCVGVRVRAGTGQGIEVAGRIRCFPGENLSMLTHLAEFTGSARASRANPVK